ncbi:hypothetical protein [Microbispora sp. CA-102843]|uniref:hypothetical protein n=1 Tax=Microbispora sp. CA-102843 TaxID=3239952 RepID=UPI003D8D6FE3
MADQSLADLIHESGLPLSTPVADLPGLTWHVTRPLATQRATMTLGQLAELTDDEIRLTSGIGERRLAKLKDSLREATAG